LKITTDIKHTTYCLITKICTYNFVYTNLDTGCSRLKYPSNYRYSHTNVTSSNSTNCAAIPTNQATNQPVNQSIF